MSHVNLSPQTLIVIESKLDNQTYAFCKRSIDVLLATTALIVLFPFLLIVALLIRLTSPGKAIYWQERVGLNGKLIMFPKFRSMVKDADLLKKSITKMNDHTDGHTFKMKKDPRVTYFGKFIRKFSIDELPQLWLVLTGDMTLVGPRPALVSEVEKYCQEERQRFLVTPGLTCIWQISGRGDVSFAEQLKMDITYINKRSLLLDFKILLLTLPAVILGKGAY
jgi:lipopolysaccharide/colanic/teichoic acid biosynthesis glycosyltransferase